MLIDVATNTDVLSLYRTVIDVVVPRPIAWATTIDQNGRVNLAPFSHFNAMGENPPIVVFSPTLRRDGSKKDTLLNLMGAVPEFVLNTVVEPLAEQMNATSKDLPRGESEADFAGLTLVPSEKVRPPRVRESPVHLECKVRQILFLGDGPIAPNLVIGEVVLIHIDDAMFDPKTGRVDPRKLRPIARLGSDYYCRAADALFEMKRP